MSQHSDIIVVGAGPTGLIFCKALADTDLSITVIDPHSQEELANPLYDGREIALTHPSKAILQKLGIWSLFEPDDIFKLKQAKVFNGNSDYDLHFPTPTKNSKNQPIDTLGYFVSNRNIRKAAYDSVANQKNLSWKLNLKVAVASTENDKATVVLENGDTLTADLLVAADSRFSSTRQQVGIESDYLNYDRTVLVFRIEHELANDHTATECFFYGSTLGLLPLSDHITNCVITLKNDKVQTLKNMSKLQLADYVNEKISQRYGELKVISDIIEYPLVGVHAQKFYSKRCALIGDAACGTHPVTAQGFNLGLQSADILSGLIKEVTAKNQDIGKTSLLRQYNLRHQINTRVIYHGTNIIVKLFTDDRLPIRVIRHAVIQASNRMTPLKQLITQRLTG